MAKPCLLLTNKSDLKFARKAVNRWPVVLPGHHQLYVMAKNDGLSVIEPHDVLPAAGYEGVCKDVADNLRLLQTFVQDYAPVELGNYIMARSVRQLYLANLTRLSSRRGLDLFRRDFTGRAVKASTPIEKNTIFKKNLSSHSDLDRPYVLDMQSPSGKKTKTFSSEYPKADLAFVTPVDMFKQKLFRKKNENKILLTAVYSSQSVLFHKFSTLSKLFKREFFDPLQALIEGVEKSYHGSYQALQMFYSQNELPREAWFNHVKNTQMAALMTFLRDQGVPVKMQSHGGLHVFGTGDQAIITSALSDGMYNNYPAVADIHPRSICQVNKVYDKQNVEIQYTPYPCPKKASKKAFTILFAPNFLNWWETNWGIHSTCFDIIKVLRHLVKLSERSGAFVLNVRIKLGLSDTQKKADLSKMIGIHPDTVHHLLEKQANVRDVTLESYETSISSADLIVTEGMTSVIYDALERGKPVLCLRADREVRGLAAGQRPGSNGRAVVYSDSIVDFGLPELEWLASNHFDKPLTNEEVSDFFLSQDQN